VIEIEKPSPCPGYGGAVPPSEPLATPVISMSPARTGACFVVLTRTTAGQLAECSRVQIQSWKEVIIAASWMLTAIGEAAWHNREAVHSDQLKTVFAMGLSSFEP
jgi:hypothetical protein